MKHGKLIAGVVMYLALTAWAFFGVAIHAQMTVTCDIPQCTITENKAPDTEVAQAGAVGTSDNPSPIGNDPVGPLGNPWLSLPRTDGAVAPKGIVYGPDAPQDSNWTTNPSVYYCYQDKRCMDYVLKQYYGSSGDLRPATVVSEEDDKKTVPMATYLAEREAHNRDIVSLYRQLLAVKAQLRLLANDMGKQNGCPEGYYGKKNADRTISVYCGKPSKESNTYGPLKY